MKFSSSMISKYMSCALQARFSYIDGIPELQNAAATYGTCVHAALEKYNQNGDVENAIEWFLYYWENPAELGAEPETWPKRTSFAGYREKGINTIYAYHEQNAWSSRKVLATEHKFMINFGEHQLSGIVDVLEVGSDGVLKVVDLKTGRRPNYDSLYLNIQFSIYILATLKKEFWLGYPGQEDKYGPMENGEELFERFNNKPRVGIWYDLNNMKEYNVGKRDDTDYMRLYRCLQEIDKAVKAEVFVPSISADSCMWCSYTDICTAFIPEEESGKAYT